MPRVRLRRPTDPLNTECFNCIRWITGGETWTKHHLSVFIITFFSFALIHATRKTLSTVKPSLILIWTSNSSGPLFPDEHAASDFLAFLDFGFLFAYSAGLFIGGVLGDRYDPKIVLSIGMASSAFVVFCFGYVTDYFCIYSKFIYASLWISSGLFQSVGWPTEICIIGNWFGHSSRGAVMGLWSACASVGNIIGTLICSQMLVYGYQYAFAANTTILFIFSFIVFFALITHPHLAGLPEPIESSEDEYRVIEEFMDEPAPIGFFRAWLLPGVIPYSFAYACLKLVNYGFFFWLPFYLSNNFKWSESDADNLSTWYDVGGIVAAIIAGAASDHFSSRTPIIVSMLLSSTIALFVYSKSPNSYIINGILLTITGFFIGGPANMISSSVSADLGKSRELRGSARALSTVTGIVDGTGSAGAAIGQLLIPSIMGWFGWSFVFYWFIFMMFCTTMCLVPLLYREMLAMRRVDYHNISSEDESAGERLLDEQSDNE